MSENGTFLNGITWYKPKWATKGMRIQNSSGAIYIISTLAGKYGNEFCYYENGSHDRLDTLAYHYKPLNSYSFKTECKTCSKHK